VETAKNSEPESKWTVIRWQRNNFNMAIIHVSDETAQALTAQAAATGLSLDAFLAQVAKSSSDLDEQYIRDGLNVAREQIRRGEVSQAPIESIIAKAATVHRT
jgi:hypothetical protein